MTRKEAIARLIEQQANTDTEEAHGKADRVLVELLERLGYADVTAAWGKVEKWYS